MVDGMVEPLWHCVRGYYFDEGSCTCCVDPTPCFCLANIILFNDILDHSCMNGEVVESGTPVAFQAAPAPIGEAGYFSGPGGLTHLNDQLFSGLFTQCDKKTCLSVGFFFRADINNNLVGPQGLVSYGQCPPSSASWQFIIENGDVKASIGGVTLNGGAVIPGNWYYVAFVYKSKRGIFRMYLMSPNQANTCATTCNCPGFVDEDTNIGQCAVEPRECGLEIGFTGTSMSSSEFFHGSISRVQVFTKCNMMVCEKAPCMRKGKRGKYDFPW